MLAHSVATPSGEHIQYDYRLCGRAGCMIGVRLGVRAPIENANNVGMCFAGLGAPCMSEACMHAHTGDGELAVCAHASREWRM